MSIPFTQYLLPDGHQRPTSVKRPPDIEELAKKFIASGGKYECEALTTGEVSLTAVMTIEGEPQDIAQQICPNGPSVLEAVDKLVQDSVAWGQR